MSDHPAVTAAAELSGDHANALAAITAALATPGMTAARRDDLAAFAASLYARIPAEDLALRSPEAWAALARGMLDFAGLRRRGEAKVRVFNPTPAEDGWDSAHTVVQIVNDDMPFLVDSVSMALALSQVSLHVLLHPVVHLQRDPGGHSLGLDPRADGESLMHLEIDRIAEPAEMNALKQALVAALGDVRACCADWAKMRETVVRVADELGARPMPLDDAQRQEAQAFLRWVGDDHFTFLGYREYEVADLDGEQVLRAVEGSGLGLLAGGERGAPRSIASLQAHAGGAPSALIITKTNARATVHRPGYMDYIGVLKFDAAGRAIGEQRFLGLFTSSAYNRRPWDIPLVRQRHAHVMERSGLSPNSHSGKALRHILESLPRDELFQSGEEELFRTAMGILGLQERVRTRLFLRRDRYGRFFSALVYLPRDRFNTEVRQRIEALLKDALEGERVDTTIQVGESPLAQLHMIVRPRTGATPAANAGALEAQLAQIVRNWHDELRELLVQRHGEERGLKLANRVGRALPVGYIEAATPAVAADDVEAAAALASPDDLRLSLYRPARGPEGALRFKLFRQGHDIPLSDALPMMEAMGLRILTEHPYALETPGGRLFIQDFEVESTVGEVDVPAVRAAFEEAFERTWRGQAENDGFNRLVLSAGLDWRQVAMLRGYAKYLQQVGVPFSQAYMEETLARYPQVARLLAALFAARFSPEDASATAAAVTREQLGQAMEQVSSLDEDRILRSLKAVIEATLRTNFYQRARSGAAHHDYISFKFDCERVPDLPKPRPYREIFVYSPRVEGVHLRFGPVARGGLRWSDRREDFRTEVLGLVKAQMVKNTVIVPVGAKGGFFAKRPPAGGDRDAVLAEGIACYRMFISGLLDITDNLVDGQVVHPRDVVRHDGDDPYLVVAADKGTATFSDIANAISLDYGFWMGDAFASGGSVGYDHKGMGITAKGAWESVKRHFRALGKDCQREDFTCVGIGDMSGDVFGNGMLLSQHIRLVAAFDHRHVFLDPSPDAARSFAERQRLFALPRSSWDDYDRALISEGGGIYPRSAKSIPISEPVRVALDLPEGTTQLAPAELLSAILKAPVELLWNGGIGTYVKAAGETHADVGDRANNALRINGGELRCKVVGEGGNLGMTQRGRIEAAQAGVLLNTDFIDNSAGVDTSDHEVNIKILLNAAVQRGDLSTPQRNALLAEMTAEVGELVLNDNYRQNQAISLMERQSHPRMGSFRHFIRTLESQGLLDRGLEFLPSEAEFAERKSRGLGLTRPELSILLSYDKIVAYNQLLASDVPEDPYLSKELQRYFPLPLQQRYAELMEGHRLRREIIATAVTNSTINRMGATFLMRMQEDTGASVGEIAKAYTISREVLDARALWTTIDGLDGQVAEDVQIDALQQIWGLQRQLTRWLLGRPGQKLDIAAAVDRYKPGLDALRAAMPGVLAADGREAHAAELARWREAGLPDAFAAELAVLGFLDAGLDIVELAVSRQQPVADVARAWFGLGEGLQVGWMLARIEELPVEGRWHALARGALRDELQAQQRALALQVLQAGGKVQAWMDRDDAALKYTLAMLADIRTQRGIDYPTVQVAVRRLAQLAQAGGA